MKLKVSYRRCLQLTFLLHGSIFKLLILSTGTNIAMNMMAEGCVSAPECQTPLNKSWIISMQFYAMTWYYNHGIRILCTKCMTYVYWSASMWLLWPFWHQRSVNHGKDRPLAQGRKKCCGNGSPPDACETLSVGSRYNKQFWYPCLKAENQSVNTYLKRHVGNCSNKNIAFMYENRDSLYLYTTISFQTPLATIAIMSWRLPSHNMKLWSVTSTCGMCPQQ